MNNYKVYEQFFAKVVEDGNYRRREKYFKQEIVFTIMILEQGKCLNAKGLCMRF